MGRERFTTNPFPDLALTPDEVAELHELSQSLIREHVERYEELLFEDGGRLDERRWKYHSRDEDMCAYYERSQKELDRRVRRSAAAGAQHQLTASELPVIITFGSLMGNLDDVMFGLVNPTIDIMRVKASYVDDLQGAAVMARLIEPTLENPFTSLIIKWMVLDAPLNSTSLVKNRDFVYMEATGFVTLRNGERVGYHQLHSVEFPAMRDLPNLVRARCAVCGLFRQVGLNTTENLSFGTMNAGGEIPRMFQVTIAAKALLSATRYSYCGQMKKLAWMLEKRQAERRDGGGHHGPKVASAATSVCVSCGRKPFLSSSSKCRLCFRSVCSSCRIVKKMSFITPDSQLIKRKVPFCTACINAAVRTGATDAARDQIVGAIGTSASVVRSNSLSDTSSELSSSKQPAQWSIS